MLLSARRLLSSSRAGQRSLQRWPRGSSRSKSTMQMPPSFESDAATIQSALSQLQNTTTQSTPLPRAVGYWLFGMGGLVAGMVTVGGITRLTRSGLSMTDWKLQGSLPPLNQADWEREFERYKLFPEWQQRKSMTLDEFKFIYFWEYGHRMMGRFIGLAFTLPLIYFGARGMIPRASWPRMGLLFSLGGGQGLIGWWMVKSGLEVDAEAHKHKEIRVSPYRLATHLGMAFTTYTAVLWTALGAFNTNAHALDWASRLAVAGAGVGSAATATAGVSNSTGAAVLASLTASKASVTHLFQSSKLLRRLAVGNGALVGLTILSGAFVAGNDAGRAFNTFPIDGTGWMNGEWLPSEAFDMQPAWRNFFENTATVQFDHRVLAMTTLASVTGSYAFARTALNGAVWRSLPVWSQRGMHACLGMVYAQAGLGIATLLLYVPIPLAAVHQIGSLTLLTFLTATAHSLNYTRYGKMATAAGAAASAGRAAVAAAAK